mgnify:CR=1 FL=1|jgi:hypothetical protein
MSIKIEARGLGKTFDKKEKKFCTELFVTFKFGLVIFYIEAFPND